MRSHPVVVGPPRRRRLHSGLIGIVVALALLVTGVHLSPGAEAAETGVRPSTMSLSRFVSTNLSGLTARAGLPEDLEEGGDYTFELDLGDTSKVDMDAVREALDTLNREDRLSDYLKQQAELHSDDNGPPPEIPDFDADLKLDGSKIHVTIPAEDVHTEATWWQNVIAGIVGSAAGVLAVGACTYFLASFGPEMIRRACGFTGGFVSTFSIVLILNAFDGKLRDRMAWANALALSLAVGIMGAGLGDWLQGQTPAVITKIKDAIGLMVDGLKEGFRALLVPIGGRALQAYFYVRGLIDTLREKIGGAIEYVLDKLRSPSLLCDSRDLDDLAGAGSSDDRTGPGGNVAAHGEYIDGDGDGRPDFVDNDGDGVVSAGDALVGDITTRQDGERRYELIGVASVQEVG